MAFKRRYGRFKKYSKRYGPKVYKLNNHLRNLTFNTQLSMNNSKQTLTLISNNDAAILYDPNTYKESNVYTQVFSNPGNTNKLIRTYLEGSEDIVKVKGEVELVNSISDNNLLKTDTITIEIIIDYQYKNVSVINNLDNSINPMMNMIEESFMYKYMNERYTDFKKKNLNEKEELKKNLIKDKNYDEQKLKYLTPFLSYLQTMLYNKDIPLDENNLRFIYTKQMLVNTNDKPQTLKFSFYPTKPVSPYLVNYVLSGWTVKMRISNSSSSVNSLCIHTSVLVMDKMLSYKNRQKNLMRKFGKIKKAFETLREQNRNGTSTFVDMIKNIEKENPHLIEEGRRLTNNKLDYFYRKIQLSKIWISQSFPLSKNNNTTIVLLDKNTINSTFSITNWRMKVKKIYLNLNYRATNNLQNYPINIFIMLHSWNPIKSEYSQFQLAYGTIYRNDIKQNLKKNTFIIQDKRFSQFYFKNDTDFITLTFDYSEKIDENSTLLNDMGIFIDLQQCYIKYKPIINLRSTVQDDMFYYPIKFVYPVNPVNSLINEEE